MKKTTLTILTLSALIAAGFFTVNQAKAEDNGADYPPIIQRLIEKFNLDGEDVEEVFAEAREEKRSRMQAHFGERLSELVEEGQLTEEQKQAILAKKEAMRQESQNWQDLTLEEKREQMEQHREEMQVWAESEGIDLSLMFGHGLGKKDGFGEKAGGYWH